MFNIGTLVRMGFLTLALAFHVNAKAATKQPDRIKDCPIGLVCFTIEQAVDINKRVIEMEKELSIAKASRHKPLGLCAGGGGGVSASLDSGKFELTPAVGGYLIYGFRFP